MTFSLCIYILHSVMYHYILPKLATWDTSAVNYVYNLRSAAPSHCFSDSWLECMHVSLKAFAIYVAEQHWIELCTCSSQETSSKLQGVQQRKCDHKCRQSFFMLPPFISFLVLFHVTFCNLNTLVLIWTSCNHL